MWVVTGTGTSGRTYTYEVDLPTYAPKEAVWDSACRAHGEAKRAGRVSEFLDIRPGTYSMHPKGAEGELLAILDRAADKGLTLSAADIEWRDGDAVIDGMSADEWLSAM